MDSKPANVATKDDVQSLRDGMDQLTVRLTNRMDQLERSICDLTQGQAQLWREVTSLREDREDLHSQLKQSSQDGSSPQPDLNDPERHDTGWNVRGDGVRESQGETIDENITHFQRRSRMGGRSEGEGDAMAFIHAADSASWAMFLQTKLHSDSYRIQSYLHHEPNQNYVPDIFTSSQTCAVLISPMLLEPQHSVFWSRCAERFHRRTVLLFLGVEQAELKVALGTSVSKLVLSHYCLNVDGSKEAVSNALIKLIEVFESSSELSSLHSLREDSDGEDEEEEYDIYDRPPQPRQQNSLVQVMPEVLHEGDSRDVLFVLERQAEGTLTMLAETCFGPPQQIAMKHVVSSAYLVTLPDDLMGKVDITILSKDERNLGKASLQVRSSMEQLRYLLEKETSPMSVLCRVLGVSRTTTSSETEEFDSMLAKRLSFCQFPTALTNILHSDDQKAGDQGSSQWPTLLHFAAEFNLMRVCEELLRYPGIIHAACTENCDGFFPCQLAERNSFTTLQKRLVQYVEDMRLRRSAADSGISCSENIPAPSPHTSQGPLYVNERPPSADSCTAADEASEDYVDMSGRKFSYYGGLWRCQEVGEGEKGQILTAPSPCLRKLTDGYAKPRSYSEGCVKTPYAKTPSEARIAEEDSRESEPPPLRPKMSRTQSAASSFLTKPHLLGSEKRPDSSSSETSDTPEVRQDESNGRSSTETLTNSDSGATSGSELKSEEKRNSESGARSSLELKSEGKGEDQEGRESWCSGSTAERPASQMSSASSQSDFDLSAEHPDAGLDDSPVLRMKNSKRSKSVQDKISNFFKKIKPVRRLHSTSESDLPTKGTKKPIVYSRSSTSSDPLGYTLKSKGAERERDSRVVCEDQRSSVAMRVKGGYSSMSRSSGKRNAVSMQRRVSVRVQRAKNEDLSETPTLPARKSITEPKETFVSFIK
ncbi:hypothetical protein ACOMHN_010715 [Nucella lapillus]